MSTERDLSGGTASCIWGPPGPIDVLKDSIDQNNIMHQIQEFEAHLM